MSDRLYRKAGAGPWYATYYSPDGTRRIFCTRQLDRIAAKRVLRERERNPDAPQVARGLSAGDEACGHTVTDALRFLVEDRSILDGKCGGAGGWRA